LNEEIDMSKMIPSPIFHPLLFLVLFSYPSSGSSFLIKTATSTLPITVKQPYESKKHQPSSHSVAVERESISTETNSNALLDQATEFLSSFQAAWNTQSASDIVNNFFVKGSFVAIDENDEEVGGTTDQSQPFWRDMVAFTWNICTNEGSEAIERAIKGTLTSGTIRTRPMTTWSVSSQPLPLQETTEGIEFWCDLEIATVGSGKAHFRLTETSDGNDYKIRTLLTTLMELKDKPFLVEKNRIRGHIHGPLPKRKYWSELAQDQDLQNDAVVIVGGGQAGLALAARLHLMQIPYVILESGPKPGMAWRNRYPSLHLHDPVYYNHMPYLPFPETWPLFCPRDKIADWMEFYAKALDLNVRTNCRVTQVCREGEDDGSWIVYCETPDDPGGDILRQQRTDVIRTRNVVFATGNSSKPRIPTIPGHFTGRQLHSSQYSGGRPFANQHVVVVGSNNSAFDIVQDLWEQGIKSVTMIQRTPSMVVSTDSVLQHGLGPLYRQDATLHHEEADLVATTFPYKLSFPRWRLVNERMQDMDKTMHEGLINAGFQLDQGPARAGIFAKSATEGGGFYINMGSAELVIRGEVAVRYATVSRFEGENIVILDKVTKQEDYLPADTVVFATGFETMDQWVAQLCGEDVAKKVGRTWGLGLGKRPTKDPGPWEGELRNMWKPTAVEGLWFHGGNLAQSRHYSRFLALQLAARYMGIEAPVYGSPAPTQPELST
jgi:putative flavoprotein involved in K+ transport